MEIEHLLATLLQCNADDRRATLTEAAQQLTVHQKLAWTVDIRRDMGIQPLTTQNWSLRKLEGK